MDLSIIIVNWRVRELVRRLLASILTHTSDITFEVFLIDNDSGDGTPEIIHAEFPQVQVIANTQNLGFAKACNQGISQSRGEFVLLLNPDTELFDNALAKLVTWMRSRREVGILGGKLLYPDRRLQPGVRRFPTFASQALIILKLHHLFPKLAPLRSYFARDFDYDREQEVDQVMGALFCIQREVIEKIGLLDEAFFIWFEEVDYCKRAKAAGFKVVYTPAVSVIHHGGQSFAQVFSLKKQQMFNRSLQTYMHKHHGFWPWLGISILSPVSLALAWVSQLFRHQ